MAEENKEGDNEKLKTAIQDSSIGLPPQETIKEFKLTITKNLKNSQLSVQGPGNGQFYDTWVCLGLLDDAKDFIKMHNAKMAQSKIIKPQVNMAQQVRNMFRRR